MNNLKEENEKFLNIIKVLGLLKDIKDIDDNQLINSKVNLKDTFEKLNKYVRDNEIRYIDGDKILSAECLIHICNIDKHHIYENGFDKFLDDALRIYQMATQENIFKEGTHLVRRFEWLNNFEDYRIKLDQLKIRKVMDYINNNQEHIKIEIKRSFSSKYLPKIILNNKDEIYAYMIKNGRRILLTDKQIKGFKDFVRVLMRRDYDIIYIPYINKDYGKVILSSYDAYDWMDNETYINLLKIFNVTDYNISNSLTYIRASQCKWDLKYILKQLFVGNIGYSKYKKVRKFINSLIDILNKKDDKVDYETAYKLKHIGDILKQLNENVEYNTYNNGFNEVSFRILAYTDYNSLDDIIKRCKRLYINEVETYNISEDKHYTISTTNIHYRNKMYDSNNYIVIFTNKRVQVVPNLDIDMIEREDVLLIIGGYRNKV